MGKAKDKREFFVLNMKSTELITYNINRPLNRASKSYMRTNKLAEIFLKKKLNLNFSKLLRQFLFTQWN